jgi:hypothetical protein
MKKIIVLAILVLISTKFSAQTLEQNKSTFYINVFINENKDIRIESELVGIENVEGEVKKRINDRELKLDENVTYRIFADKNLMLDVIMNVEQKMFAAHNQNAKRERYLLETTEMEIDGSNWLKKIEGLEIDKMKG